jgi:tetratricopeptide (TPR) repeat protein
MTAAVVSLFNTLKSNIALGLVFLFPLFFLPTTQEFFTTNKMYLLAFGAIVLVALSTVEFVFSRQIVWKRRAFDSAAMLFVLGLGLSIVLSSPNKIQAVLNPNFGLLVVASLTTLYFYLSRGNVTGVTARKVLSVLTASGFVVAVLTLLFFFNPFKSMALPQTLAFLKNATFTPMGDQLSLAIFLGFFVVLQLGKILTMKHLDGSQKSMRGMMPSLGALLVFGLALALNLYPLVKSGNLNALPPFSISWYSAVEILKTPMTALFGVGVDNFASIFSRSKDVAYNATQLWQVQSFNASRSTLLHVFTETGIFGVLGFVLLIAALLREMSLRARQNGTVIETLLPVGYVLAVVLLLPPSLTTFFLLFVVFVVVEHRHAASEDTHVTSMDVSQLLPVYLGVAIVAALIVGATTYLTARAYAAEVSFKKALDGIVKNNIADLYSNQRDAILINPYIERYRLNFSQTNMLIANNIAAKAAPQKGETAEQAAAKAKERLTDKDREQIGQAIQAAISEAKAAVALNPAKASNWENLANIYRNVLFVAQGADSWTISSYQRAIVLDPQNPVYRVDLGGVYFSLQQYDEAVKLFEQAVSLKSDWSNARYNLAWAYAQKQNFQRAAEEMQAVLSLLDPKKDEADFKKASQDLEVFKSKIPKDQQATQSGQSQEPQQLNLATPNSATVEPKLQLPKDANPEPPKQ